MRDRLDRSTFIARLIENASASVAQQQGLVPMIGIVLVIVGMILLLVNVFVGHAALAFFGILLEGVGVIAALIGILLIEPLGK
jgi:hypothetical protein